MRACPPSGRGRGTGPDGDKFRRGGTQETLGGAEAKRSPEEGLCPVLAKRPDIKKKPAKNLFLVGLILFCRLIILASFSVYGQYYFPIQRSLLPEL